MPSYIAESENTSLLSISENNLDCSNACSNSITVISSSVNNRNDLEQLSPGYEKYLFNTNLLFYDYLSGKVSSLHIVPVLIWKRRRLT